MRSGDFGIRAERTNNWFARRFYFLCGWLGWGPLAFVEILDGDEEASERRISKLLLWILIILAVCIALPIGTIVSDRLGFIIFGIAYFVLGVVHYAQARNWAF